jgi:hypothetical protein
MSIQLDRDAQGGLIARATVRVGLRQLELQVPLGPWDGPGPDPEGLRHRPVAVVGGRAQVALAVAGIVRSGRLQPRTLLAGPRLGVELLADDAAASVVDGLDAVTLETIRCLGGRPLPALPLSRAGNVDAVLQGCRIDLDVVVPSHDDRTRATAHAAAVALGLATDHHLVEVDPRPAFDELGREGATAGLDETIAAAVGVLAGRLASGNRRWRSQL